MKVINKPYEKDCKDSLKVELGLDEMDIIAKALKEYKENGADYNLSENYYDSLIGMIEDIKELGGFYY